MFSIIQINIMYNYWHLSRGKKVGEHKAFFERYANKNGRDIPLVSLSQVEWKMFGMHMHN